MEIVEWYNLFYDRENSIFIRVSNKKKKFIIVIKMLRYKRTNKRRRLLKKQLLISKELKVNSDWNAGFVQIFQGDSTVK